MTIGVLSARDRIKKQGVGGEIIIGQGLAFGAADVGRRMIYCCSVLGGIWPPSQSPGLVAGREGGREGSTRRHLQTFYGQSGAVGGGTGLAVSDGAAIPKEIYF